MTSTAETRPPARSGTAETLHGLVLERARRDPGRTAVSLGDERWSYGELDRRSAALARRLRQLGVGPDRRVAIVAGRSFETVAGVLAVLRAGGAYVPLDPDYPAERLEFMGRDSGATAVLVEERRLREMAAGRAGGFLAGGAEVVLLEDQGEDRDEGGDGGAGPDDLAYVIYTSGSTGRPKGVMVEHRGAVNVVRESSRLLRVGPESRVLQLASLSFDASVLEIFTALGAGAELVLTPRETLLSGEALGAELRRRRVTTLAIPPSLLDKVPEELSASGGLPDLVSIVVGGETCSAATAERWAPGRRFFNAYAPTEATIYITAHECRPPFDPAAGGPPIGRAIAGGAVHVLGSDLSPVADGEAGELCLGGVGVARGYLGRPALTAERLAPDPFGARPGARVYRSGDLGRRLPDGSLAFLGRADDQVKLRGVRLELGEVEAVLAEHPAIRSAAARLWQEAAEGDGGGGEPDARLAAYYVPREGRRPTVSELRRFLAERLPEAMVPGSFVRLDALPMAPTGKVDRRALPDPGRERPELDAAYEPPRSATEGALAGIWADILGLDRVGVHDDLFALGGHSLIVTRIATRVRGELGRELPLLTVFERPTVAGLAAWLDGGLDGGLAGGTEGGEAGAGEPPPELPPIEPVPRDGRPLPVSFPQERVWFLLQLAPDAIAYNFQFTIRFRGPFDPALFERALTEVVRRHEVLRTTFPAVDGRPVQAIHEPFSVALGRVDLTALPLERRLTAAHAAVRREIRRGFDVTRLPLFRPSVFVLGDEDHLFLQVEHHFVHDGWSLAVYLEELQELYAAFAAGRPSPLRDLAIQYADFAAWQRAWLDGPAYERQLAYWRRQLAGELPVLALPTDRPRPRAHAFRGGALRVDMHPELYAAARRFSREQGMTLFMTMLAGFYALLHRYTGQEDVLLGSGLANRRHRETEELVGMVVNTVVLRARPEARASFRELLERVRATTLEAHLHQDMPFERLVQELQPERDLSRNPLFQVLFSFHDAAVPDLEVPELGLSGELFEWHNGSAKSDLNVVVKPLAEQRVGRKSTGGELLTMVWEHSADILDRGTVERMWGHYQTLLRGAFEAPGRPLAELPLLTAAEAAEIRALSDAAPAPGGGEPVHRVVARRARERPEAPAVIAGELVLRYGELAARAGRLARRLRALPGWRGPETVVALLTGRSAETAVGALAVAAAGGAYLPVDPDYPEERIAFMLADSGAVAVVAREALRGRLPAGGPPVLVLDAAEPAEQTGEPDAADELCRADGWHPERLAYVIYTSGSSGRPKGVELTHRGLANLVAWHRAAYRPGPEDRATLLAGPGFDAAVWELWPVLASGAALCVPPEELRAAPEELLAWLAEAGITLAFLATPLAEAALDAIRSRGVPEGLRLRSLLTGGDRLHRPPPAGLPFAVVNHYGPTESTVVSTAGDVAADSRVPPPIGGPIAGLGARVLDRWLGEVPVGVPGELCVAGRGLARGYRGRPAWTAGAFLPDPAGGERGSRIYRTGDLARWLPDGRLEFLGRIDNQVQVRGFRVELGEIEAVLAAHPGVREAVVLARTPPAGGEARLVAYPVPAAAEVPDPEALRAWLACRLPDYMVPRHFVPIAEVPLTPNGKVDRAALPEPDAGPAAGEAHVPPRTPLEELLAGVWAEVLGVERVGATDDFFHLGGHSLLATRVLSRLRDALGVEVPLAALFEAPTVAGLAAAVEGGARPGEVAERPAEDRIPRRAGAGPAPLSFTQERLWFLDRLAPGTAAYVVGRSYRIAGELDAGALARALSAVVARHQALRTRFAAREGAPVQVIAPAAPVPLPVVDLSGLGRERAAAEARRLAEEHARRPFDLAAGPVLRSALVRLAPEEHHWLVAFHHIVSDGWSMAVFHREIGALYRAARARRAGRPPAPTELAELAELPALPIQYADFAAWQRQRLQGQVLDAQLAFWRRHLAGAPALLELPADHSRPPVQRFRGAQVAAELPAELLARLDRLARTSGATRFMVLLAAFAALLARASRQDDVVVGTPVAGRGRSELEPLIGFFVNTLPLRIELVPGASFRDLLARARRATLDGHAHQELPFEKLVEELQPRRNLSHSPLFQVLLALQERMPEAPELAGAETAALPVERREARFDLELAAAESAAGDLRLRLRYDRDLFHEPTAARMLGSLRTLLAAVAEDPETAWEALPLLTADERRQALAAGEGPPLPAAAGEPAGIHSEVERQAGRTPAAEALLWDGESLTYRELLARSHRLARHLIALGVGPEVPVAVFLPRSPELVVALLAVLEAGGCYVPLDPDYPEERLRFILEDTRTPVVVTTEALAERLPEDGARSGVELVRLDADAAAIAGRSAEPPDVEVAPETLAYVIYTSGSTGRPKGVAIPHRATQALLAWARGVFAEEELAGVLASTSVCFDLSVFELFLPLSAGGRIVLAENVLALPRLPERDRVTLVNTVPSAMAELESMAGLPASVVTVNLAGEPLRPDLADRLYARGLARVHDLYGPSEDTTYSTFARRVPGGPETIGRPVAGTRVHLLDPRLEPVPPGAAGEVVLGGAGLARGYLGRPALTAERFLPDPFAGPADEERGDSPGARQLVSGAAPGARQLISDGAPGARLYRTGDLARRLPDGNLQFLGRIDHQVKVRGFRIELGEIEAALTALPEVREAVVVAPPGPSGEPGDRRLIAYVVPEPPGAGSADPPPAGTAAAGGAGSAEPGVAIDPQALREAVARRLPAYMVPSAVAVLGELPRLPNGKIDRKRLPEVEAGTAADQHVPPETETERALAEIWREVLDREPIGATDDFFALGGHSLLATRVIARVHRRLGADLPLRALFEHPTLRALAREVDQAREAGETPPQPRIQRLERTRTTRPVTA